MKMLYSLLTLGVHAQRGLQYSVCHCLSGCLAVCPHRMWVEPGLNPMWAEPGLNPMWAEPGLNPMWAEPGLNPMWVEPGLNPMWAEPGLNPMWAEPGLNPMWVEPGLNPMWVEPGLNPMWAEPGLNPMWVEPGLNPMWVEPGLNPMWAEPNATTLQKAAIKYGVAAPTVWRWRVELKLHQPKYSAMQKKYIIKFAETNSLKEAAQRYGITGKTIQNWRKALQADGELTGDLSGLMTGADIIESASQESEVVTYDTQSFQFIVDGGEVVEMAGAAGNGGDGGKGGRGKGGGVELGGAGGPEHVPPLTEQMQVSNVPLEVTNEVCTNSVNSPQVVLLVRYTHTHTHTLTLINPLLGVGALLLRLFLY